MHKQNDDRMDTEYKLSSPYYVMVLEIADRLLKKGQKGVLIATLVIVDRSYCLGGESYSWACVGLATTDEFY